MVWYGTFSDLDPYKLVKTDFQASLFFLSLIVCLKLAQHITGIEKQRVKCFNKKRVTFCQVSNYKHTVSPGMECQVPGKRPQRKASQCLNHVRNMRFIPNIFLVSVQRG